MNTTEIRAIELGSTLVTLWANYNDENSPETDAAMHEATLAIRALDLHQVDGVLASPLNYWARAELDHDNPEDLTYCQMLESIEISVRIMKGEVV